MKKYFMTMAVMAVFAIGFAASDEDSSNSGSSDSATQVEKQEEKKESNPNAKFAGLYTIYDELDRADEKNFTVDEDGRFVQGKKGAGVVSGYINPINENQFTVGLSEQIFGINKIWTYVDDNRHSSQWYEIRPTNILLFDIKEKRMYIDFDKYKNRDYESAQFYKFRYTK